MCAYTVCRRGHAGDEIAIGDAAVKRVRTADCVDRLAYIDVVQQGILTMNVGAWCTDFHIDITDEVQ